MQNFESRLDAFPIDEIAAEALALEAPKQLARDEGEKLEQDASESLGRLQETELGPSPTESVRKSNQIRMSDLVYKFNASFANNTTSLESAPSAFGQNDSTIRIANNMSDFASLNATSSSPANDEQAPENPMMEYVLQIMVGLHLIVFVSGLVGNTLVCLSVYRNKSLQTVTNYFIVNLAVADFLVILICLPPTVYWDVYLTWSFGLALCKLVTYLQTVTVCVSVLNLTAISMDRWYAICRPLQFSSSKHRAKISIALIWFTSLLIALPEAIYSTTTLLYEDGSSVYMSCTYSWPNSHTTIYQLCILFITFVLPFILMTISYSHIVNVLWRNEAISDKSMIDQEPHQNQNQNQEHRQPQPHHRQHHQQQQQKTRLAHSPNTYSNTISESNSNANVNVSEIVPSIKNKSNSYFNTATTKTDTRREQEQEQEQQDPLMSDGRGRGASSGPKLDTRETPPTGRRGRDAPAGQLKSTAARIKSTSRERAPTLLGWPLPRNSKNLATKMSRKLGLLASEGEHSQSSKKQGDFDCEPEREEQTMAPGCDLSHKCAPRTRGIREQEMAMEMEMANDDRERAPIEGPPFQEIAMGMGMGLEIEMDDDKWRTVGGHKAAHLLMRPKVEFDGETTIIASDAGPQLKYCPVCLEINVACRAALGRRAAAAVKRQFSLPTMAPPNAANLCSAGRSLAPTGASLGPKAATIKRTDGHKSASGTGDRPDDMDNCKQNSSIWSQQNCATKSARAILDCDLQQQRRDLNLAKLIARRANKTLYLSENNAASSAGSKGGPISITPTSRWPELACKKKLHKSDCQCRWRCQCNDWRPIGEPESLCDAHASKLARLARYINSPRSPGPPVCCKFVKKLLGEVVQGQSDNNQRAFSCSHSHAAELNQDPNLRVQTMAAPGPNSGHWPDPKSLCDVNTNTNAIANANSNANANDNDDRIICKLHRSPRLNPILIRAPIPITMRACNSRTIVQLFPNPIMNENGRRAAGSQPNKKSSGHLGGVTRELGTSSGSFNARTSHCNYCACFRATPSSIARVKFNTPRLRANKRQATGEIARNSSPARTTKNDDSIGRLGAVLQERDAIRLGHGANSGLASEKGGCKEEVENCAASSAGERQITSKTRSSVVVIELDPTETPTHQNKSNSNHDKDNQQREMSCPKTPTSPDVANGRGGGGAKNAGNGCNSGRAAEVDLGSAGGGGSGNDSIKVINGDGDAGDINMNYEIIGCKQEQQCSSRSDNNFAGSSQDVAERTCYESPVSSAADSSSTPPTPTLQHLLRALKWPGQLAVVGARESHANQHSQSANNLMCELLEAGAKSGLLISRSSTQVELEQADADANKLAIRDRGLASDAVDRGAFARANSRSAGLAAAAADKQVERRPKIQSEAELPLNELASNPLSPSMEVGAGAGSAGGSSVGVSRPIESREEEQEDGIFDVNNNRNNNEAPKRAPIDSSANRRVGRRRAGLDGPGLNGPPSWGSGANQMKIDERRNKSEQQNESAGAVIESRASLRMCAAEFNGQIGLIIKGNWAKLEQLQPLEAKDQWRHCCGPVERGARLLEGGAGNERGRRSLSLAGRLKSAPGRKINCERPGGARVPHQLNNCGPLLASGRASCPELTSTRKASNNDNDIKLGARHSSIDMAAAAELNGSLLAGPAPLTGEHPDAAGANEPRKAIQNLAAIKAKILKAELKLDRNELGEENKVGGETGVGLELGLEVALALALARSAAAAAACYCPSIDQLGPQPEAPRPRVGPPEDDGLSPNCVVCCLLGSGIFLGPAQNSSSRGIGREDSNSAELKLLMHLLALHGRHQRHHNRAQMKSKSRLHQSNQMKSNCKFGRGRGSKGLKLVASKRAKIELNRVLLLASDTLNGARDRESALGASQMEGAAGHAPLIPNQTRANRPGPLNNNGHQSRTGRHKVSCNQVYFSYGINNENENNETNTERPNAAKCWHRARECARMVAGEISASPANGAEFKGRHLQRGRTRAPRPPESRRNLSLGPGGPTSAICYNCGLNRRARCRRCRPCRRRRYLCRCELGPPETDTSCCGMIDPGVGLSGGGGPFASGPSGPGGQLSPGQAAKSRPSSGERPAFDGPVRVAGPGERGHYCKCKSGEQAAREIRSPCYSSSCCCRCPSQSGAPSRANINEQGWPANRARVDGDLDPPGPSATFNWRRGNSTGAIRGRGRSGAACGQRRSLDGSLELWAAGREPLASSSPDRPVAKCEQRSPSILFAEGQKSPMGRQPNASPRPPTLTICPIDRLNEKGHSSANQIPGNSSKFQIARRLARRQTNSTNWLERSRRTSTIAIAATPESLACPNSNSNLHGTTTNGSTSSPTPTPPPPAACSQPNSSINQNRFCKLIESRRKAAKMLIVIVIMFGLCFLPVHFLNLLRCTVGLPQNDFTLMASLISHWLCYFNSAINPLIYNLMSGKFRHEFANLFTCNCWTKKKPQQQFQHRKLQHHNPPIRPSRAASLNVAWLA